MSNKEIYVFRSTSLSFGLVSFLFFFSNASSISLSTASLSCNNNHRIQARRIPMIPGYISFTLIHISTYRIHTCHLDPNEKQRIRCKDSNKKKTLKHLNNCIFCTKVFLYWNFWNYSRFLFLLCTCAVVKLWIEVPVVCLW